MSIGMIVDTVGGRMPECCDGCPLEKWDHNGMEYACVLNEYDLRTPEERSKSIGDWCPLQEVEPVKHGSWSDATVNNGELYNKCSECGHLTPFSMPSRFSYCPNCGAKMDGGGI